MAVPFHTHTHTEGFIHSTGGAGQEAGWAVVQGASLAPGEEGVGFMDFMDFTRLCGGTREGPPRSRWH